LSESPPAPKEKKVEKIKAYVIVVRCPRCDTVFLDLLVDPVKCPICGFEMYVNEFVEVPV